MNKTASPPNLAMIQQQFGDALATHCSDAQIRNGYLAINGDNKVHPQARLHVYRANVIGAHYQALANAYPACTRILGERCLRPMAEDYRQRWPSTSPDLNHYGQHLPELLSKLCQQQSGFHDYPYLPDLARLEWALHQAYFQADDPSFDWQQLAQVEPERQQQLIPRLASHVQLIDSPYPLDLLHQGRNNGRIELPANDSGERCLIIYRQQHKPRYQVLQNALYALLKAIDEGLSLGQMVEQGHDPQTLSHCIQQGWVSAIEQPSNEAGQQPGAER